MSIQRVAIKDFVSDLKAAEKRRDGYIMGSRGQNPKKWAKKFVVVHSVLGRAEGQGAVLARERAARMGLQWAGRGHI